MERQEFHDGTLNFVSNVKILIYKNILQPSCSIRMNLFAMFFIILDPNKER